MQCPRCGSKNFYLFSTVAQSGAKRYKCKDCKKRFNSNTGMGINKESDGRDKQQTRSYTENAFHGCDHIFSKIGINLQIRYLWGVFGWW